MPASDHSSPDFHKLTQQIRAWGAQLGFQQIGIAPVELDREAPRLQQWLDRQYHGDMDYMHKHGSKRTHPEELVPGTLRVISVRMDYLPAETRSPTELLEQPEHAYVSRYALGRDYHKVMRRRLQQLADKIAAEVGPFGYRAFTDSAPVLEKPLARNAGLGWVGKHTNLINKDAGSWFFLGELFTDLPLPADTPATEHCGTCTTCIDVCPTDAIVNPFELDARKCISYLTIELKGSIPEKFRAQIGNRIYGCDDCQLFCPWNKFAKPTAEGDFAPRHGLDNSQLVDLFNWSENEWLEKTAGSAIRRIGYERWLRNLAVALGNAPTTAKVLAALNNHKDSSSELVREHVAWALAQHA
jgi:epoxyqueuosine reductase